MFKQIFKAQNRIEIIDGVKSNDEVILQKYSANGNSIMTQITIQTEDIEDVIKLLQRFVKK